MVWAAIGSAAVSVVGGALLNGGGGGGGGNPGAAQAADPFASQRAQYQPMLQNLVMNPSSVANTPGYQFNMQQGLNAVQAGSAAKGLGTSGANDTAKMQYAQGLAANTYQQDFNELALLSGATTGNQAAAASAITTGNNNINNALGTIGGAVGKGIGNWLNGPSSPSGTATGDGNGTPAMNGSGNSTLDQIYGTGGTGTSGSYGSGYSGLNGPSTFGQG
jgi:hypothetical protein